MAEDCSFSLEGGALDRLAHMRPVLQLLADNGLCGKLSKCTFFQATTDFPHHCSSGAVIHPGPHARREASASQLPRRQIPLRLLEAPSELVTSLEGVRVHDQESIPRIFRANDALRMRWPQH